MIDLERVKVSMRRREEFIEDVLKTAPRQTARLVQVSAGLDERCSRTSTLCAYKTPVFRELCLSWSARSGAPPMPMSRTRSRPDARKEGHRRAL